MDDRRVGGPGLQQRTDGQYVGRVPLTRRLGLMTLCTIMQTMQKLVHPIVPLLAALAASMSSAIAQNLLVNPGFEACADRPAGWKLSEGGTGEWSVKAYRNPPRRRPGFVGLAERRFAAETGRIVLLAVLWPGGSRRARRLCGCRNQSG